MTWTSPITPGLEYRDDDHAYLLHGERIPSVTAILQAAGMVEGAKFFTEAGRQRGSLIHAALHDLQEDRLCFLAAELHGYILSADLFWQANRAALICSEIPMAHQVLRYGGTPDLPVVLLGEEKEPVVIDYKSGSYQAAHGVQVAAYVQLVRSNAEFLGLRGNEIPKRGLVLALQKDGSMARLHDPAAEKKPLSQAQAWAFYQSALNIYRYKENFHRGNC